MVEDSKPDKDDKNVKKESDLKKFLKKRSFLYLMCAVVFVVFFVRFFIDFGTMTTVSQEQVAENRELLSVLLWTQRSPGVYLVRKKNLDKKYYFSWRNLVFNFSNKFFWSKKC